MGKKKHTELGVALVKSRFSKSAPNREIPNNRDEKWLHSAELEDGSDWNRINLNSVTEQNSLNEFLTTAELAGTDFESERLNLNFAQPKQNAGILNKEETNLILDTQDRHKDLLRIPRRPLWKVGEHEMDGGALESKERETFLEWRRKLAQLQDVQHLTLTPFEKNIEFWRQLWRVIERSDVVMQIVDARNPLLFYCQDLEKYVTEVDPSKINLVLINKSDYLSPRQRLEWLNYFNRVNTKVVFWSAFLANQANEAKEMEEGIEEEDEENLPSEESDQSDEEELDDQQNSSINKFRLLSDEKSDNEDEMKEEEEESTEEEEEEIEEQPEKIATSPKAESPIPETKLSLEPEKTETAAEEKEAEIDTTVDEPVIELSAEDLERCKVLTREELIHLLKTVHTKPEKFKAGVTTIGMVGYPNVGKSSTINAVLQGKKVAVSETPGKTKHYQTLYVDDGLVLCDCPGLVFPSFVATRGELILNGILSIDQMRDYIEPMNLVMSHVPKNIVEMIYGFVIPKPKEGEDPNRQPSAEETCLAYSKFRGYITQRGVPDTQRGARIILKDYVNGQLLYCYPPPKVDAKSFQDHKYDLTKEFKYLQKTMKLEKKDQENSKCLTRFDLDFFTKREPRGLNRGGIVGYYRAKQRNGPTDATGQPTSSKKHFNSNKKQKLRRVTSQFDAAD